MADILIIWICWKRMKIDPHFRKLDFMEKWKHWSQSIRLKFLWSRDNLRQLLDKAMSSDRNIDKKFQTWLMECHKKLDKPILFSKLQNAQDQASRKPHTLADSISECRYFGTLLL